MVGDGDLEGGSDRVLTHGCGLPLVILSEVPFGADLGDRHHKNTVENFHGPVEEVDEVENRVSKTVFLLELADTIYAEEPDNEEEDENDEKEDGDVQDTEILDEQEGGDLEEDDSLADSFAEAPDETEGHQGEE